jgi:hypothetical protein
LHLLLKGCPFARVPVPEGEQLFCGQVVGGDSRTTPPWDMNVPARQADGCVGMLPGTASTDAACVDGGGVHPSEYYGVVHSDADHSVPVSAR